MGNLEFVRNEIVELPDGEGEAEVDVMVLKTGDEKPVTTDPFLTQNFSGLPRNMRRRADTLQKRAKKEAESKAQSPEIISAYDILQVVAPPYDMDMLAKLYELNSAHNAAVTMKAVNIVGLGYQWEPTERMKYELGKAQKSSHGSYEKKIEQLELAKIELNEALDDLNPDEEFNEIMVKVWTDVESLGNGFLEVGRNRKGQIKYIGHIPGQTMRVRALRDGFIQMVANKYVFFRNFGERDVPNPIAEENGGDTNPNEVIHFKKYSPNSTYYGVPDIIAALPAALGDKFAKEYNLDYFENKTVPRYAFILKGARLSAKAEQTLINYFRNELRGKHHGTLYIPIPAGFGQQVEAEFKEIEVGIQEGSFTEYTKENRQEILMVHRVPPGKVGVYQNANLAISRDADKTFKEQVCGPEQRRVEKKLKRFIREFTEDLDLKFSEADIIDDDIRSRIHDRYLRTQVLTPNDVLNDLGKPTRPDGGEPLPYEKGRNEGGPGQKTSDGAKPTRSSSANDTGTRRERGESQDGGRPSNDPSRVKR